MLGQHLLNAILAGSDLPGRYGRDGGPSFPLVDFRHPGRSQRERTRREDRHLKFYELRDNLEMEMEQR